MIVPETAIIAPSRIHIALLDMGRSTMRACGGIGFTIGTPRTEWRFVTTTRTHVAGLEKLDAAARDEISHLIELATDVWALKPTAIELVQAPPQHYGYGCKTSLVISLLQGLNIHHRAGLGIEQLQLFSKRGGTSGVGIHGMFRGGLIWDAGHPQSNYSEFAPSSKRPPARLPPLCGRWPFPDSLEVLLFVADGTRISGNDEAAFFRNNCPVPEVEVAKTFFAVFHGLIPSLLQGDLPTLRTAMSEIHENGFKARELQAQAPSVRLTYAKLSEIKGIAPGLSSMGPLIYGFIRRGDKDTLQNIDSLVRNAEIPPFSIARPDNNGMTVKIM